MLVQRAAPLCALREAIVGEGGWRVAHAFNSTLPGWLIVVPTRHVTAMDELSDDEATALGGLLRRVSIALCDVVGCEKTYVMLFAEQEGFSHLHVHVVPRMRWFTAEQKGPRVFSFMSDDQSAWLSEDDRDALALRLRAQLN